MQYEEEVRKGTWVRVPMTHLQPCLELGIAAVLRHEGVPHRHKYACVIIANLNRSGCSCSRGWRG